MVWRNEKSRGQSRLRAFISTAVQPLWQLEGVFLFCFQAQLGETKIFAADSKDTWLCPSHSLQTPSWRPYSNVGWWNSRDSWHGVWQTKQSLRLSFDIYAITRAYNLVPRLKLCISRQVKQSKLKHGKHPRDSNNLPFCSTQLFGKLRLSVGNIQEIWRRKSHARHWLLRNKSHREEQDNFFNFRDLDESNQSIFD